MSAFSFIKKEPEPDEAGASNTTEAEPPPQSTAEAGFSTKQRPRKEKKRAAKAGGFRPGWGTDGSAPPVVGPEHSAPVVPQAVAPTIVTPKSLSELPGNDRCADCGRRGATWCSINIGCFICLQCSGVHRSLGTHISKVRSCGLDQWSDATVQFVASRGNLITNAKFLARVPARVPDEHTPSDQLEAFIRAKYEHLEFTEGTTGAAPAAQAPSEGLPRAAAPQVQVCTSRSSHEADSANSTLAESSSCTASARVGVLESLRTREHQGQARSGEEDSKQDCSVGPLVPLAQMELALERLVGGMEGRLNERIDALGKKVDSLAELLSDRSC